MGRLKKLRKSVGMKKFKKVLPLNAELRQRLIRVEKKIDALEPSLLDGEGFVEGIDETDVLRLVKYDKHTKKNADLALNDVIVPFPNFESVDFSEGYDWQVDKSEKYGDSYQLYIQALRIVNALLLEFEKTKQIDYLKKSQEIIESWMDFMETEPENRMIWYDHPTAGRAQNLVHFLYLSKDLLELDEKRYYSVLIRHAELMSDSSEYNQNNHGLMMDRSLMVVGRILKRDDLFNIGYYRAIDTFWYSFSAKAVHLENSPAYHSMVVRMYRGMEEYLNHHGKSFGRNIIGYLENAKGYLNIIARPDGRMPAIGDSGDSVTSRSKIYRNFSDYESGMSVLQYKEPKPLYISFVSGFSTNTHKHRDDLSITLQYDLEDILVDAGKFNYSRSPLRRYIQSPQSHSTLFFEKDKYIKEHSNRFTRLVETTQFYENEKYALVKGINSGFNKSFLERTVITLKDFPVVILLDKAESEEMVYQNFNLDQKAKVDTYDKDRSIVELPSGKKVHFYQMRDVKKTVDITPSSQKPVASVNTVAFGKVAETQQMRFANDCAGRNDYTFMTLISMDEQLKINSFELESDMLRLELDDEQLILNI